MGCIADYSTHNPEDKDCDCVNCCEKAVKKKWKSYKEMLRIIRG